MQDKILSKKLTWQIDNLDLTAGVAYLLILVCEIHKLNVPTHPKLFDAQVWCAQHIPQVYKKIQTWWIIGFFSLQIPCNEASDLSAVDQKKQKNKTWN